MLDMGDKSNIRVRSRDFVRRIPGLYPVIRILRSPIRNIEFYLRDRDSVSHFFEWNNDVSLSDAKVYYFGVPIHNNLGDLAQTVCTREWLKSKFSDYDILEVESYAVRNRRFRKKLVKMITEKDILVFQSGYCTRKNNPNHIMLKTIASVCSNNRILVLPQSVLLVDEKEISKTREILSKCSRILFTTRDEVSNEMARNFISEDRSMCLPDIVTSWIGRLNYAENGKKDGVLICVRNDDEKYYSDEEIIELKNNLLTLTDRIGITDTQGRRGLDYRSKDLEECIINKINEIGTYKVIITDRFHGAVFGMIANTPVIIIKTRDHKVTATLNWFKGLYSENSIRVASDLKEALLLTKNILKENIVVNNEDHLYKKFYEKRLLEEAKKAWENFV